eukprot:CAMPEP_0175080098 /NCGR_PEP_ID=MMETSP0052_2-20121109/25277_1 /TAXON_ID=51329 ORGANISM="Polytomella parva, Strain SAG 63-3" /NCGR_SAMPLE_ID=MMETSP0052_2 /ASSEMBLY_ACC=CAM_ASM_000194 /LENGTH=644 /DNA_ID=CAMNT_0016350677 /DNA_START=293 /DNA_END=2224 /DNA_ORIENTATION=+
MSAHLCLHACVLVNRLKKKFKDLLVVIQTYQQKIRFMEEELSKSDALLCISPTVSRSSPSLPPPSSHSSQSVNPSPPPSTSLEPPAGSLEEEDSFAGFPSLPSPKAMWQGGKEVQSPKATIRGAVQGEEEGEKEKGRERGKHSEERREGKEVRKEEEAKEEEGEEGEEEEEQKKAYTRMADARGKEIIEGEPKLKKEKKRVKRIKILVKQSELKGISLNNSFTSTGTNINTNGCNSGSNSINPPPLPLPPQSVSPPLTLSSPTPPFPSPPAPLIPPSTFPTPSPLVPSPLPNPQSQPLPPLNSSLIVPQIKPLQVIEEVNQITVAENPEPINKELSPPSPLSSLSSSEPSIVLSAENCDSNDQRTDRHHNQVQSSTELSKVIVSRLTYPATAPPNTTAIATADASSNPALLVDSSTNSESTAQSRDSNAKDSKNTMGSNVHVILPNQSNPHASHPFNSSHHFIEMGSNQALVDSSSFPMPTPPVWPIWVSNSCQLTYQQHQQQRQYPNYPFPNHQQLFSSSAPHQPLVSQLMDSSKQSPSVHVQNPNLYASMDFGANHHDGQKKKEAGLHSERNIEDEVEDLTDLFNDLSNEAINVMKTVQKSTGCSYENSSLTQSDNKLPHGDSPPQDAQQEAEDWLNDTELW